VTKACSHCGLPLAIDDAYCGNCGQQVLAGPDGPDASADANDGADAAAVGPAAGRAVGGNAAGPDAADADTTDRGTTDGDATGARPASTASTESAGAGPTGAEQVGTGPQAAADDGGEVEQQPATTAGRSWPQASLADSPPRQPSETEAADGRAADADAHLAQQPGYADESRLPSPVSVPRARSGEVDDSGRASLAVATAPAVEVSEQPVRHVTIGAEMSGEGSFDPLRNTRFILQMVRRFALYGSLATVIDLVVVILLGGLGLIVAILLSLAVLTLFWLLPVPGLLEQWSRLLSYEAPKAPQVFECMTRELDQHATPRDSLQVRALSPPGEGRRDYLELRRGAYAAYISCFPHGNDLYVGWTFWIYMSPFRMLLMQIGRAIQNYTGRGNDMYQTLRYESTRATLSALRVCTSEGIREAVGDAPAYQVAVPEQVPALVQFNAQARFNVRV